MVHWPIGVGVIPLCSIHSALRMHPAVPNTRRRKHSNSHSHSSHNHSHTHTLMYCRRSHIHTRSHNRHCRRRRPKEVRGAGATQGRSEAGKMDPGMEMAIVGRTSSCLRMVVIVLMETCCSLITSVHMQKCTCIFFVYRFGVLTGICIYSDEGKDAVPLCTLVIVYTYCIKKIDKHTYSRIPFRYASRVYLPHFPFELLYICVF